MPFFPGQGLCFPAQAGLPSAPSHGPRAKEGRCYHFMRNLPQVWCLCGNWYSVSLGNVSLRVGVSSACPKRPEEYEGPSCYLSPRSVPFFPDQSPVSGKGPCQGHRFSLLCRSAILARADTGMDFCFHSLVTFPNSIIRSTGMKFLRLLIHTARLSSKKY